MESYQSSEELQRQRRADVFTAESKKQKKTLTEKDKLKRLLDMHIDTHSDTSRVRAEAKANNRENGYQLDLSADIVLILTKIKSELR